MKLHGHEIGVCSWSLQPHNASHLVDMVKALGLEHMQLALWPIVELDDKRKYLELGHLKKAGLTLTAAAMAFPGEDYSSIDAIRRTGGYAPDEEWPVRKRLSVMAAQLAAELNIGKLSTHIGFVPAETDPGYDAYWGQSRAPHVACGAGWLRLDEVKPAGKRAMSGA